MKLKNICGRATVRGQTKWWKTWQLWNRGKRLLSKIVQENASQKATNTEPMDRILLWAVQLQGQWRFISTELSPDRHRGWPAHPSQRSWGCSTIIEEREVSYNRHHPSRTGPTRWRECNHRSHDNLRQDLEDRRVANPMDPVLSHCTSHKKASCSSARTIEQSASSVTQAKLSCRSYWTDWSHKWRRSSLKNRQASEQVGAPHSRFSTYAFSLRNISNASKTSTMSS